MKKNLVKTMVAAVCVVAAGMGGSKAYSFANQAQADMLLAENVDALSQIEGEKSSKDQARYIQTSRGLMVTGITGNVNLAAKLNISIGKILKGDAASLASQAGLTLTVKTVNTYKETCYYNKGSNCMCEPTDDFIPCSSSGCPKDCK